MKKHIILGAACFAFFNIQAQEKHLSNIKQLTFGGDNAEAYFSFDNTHLTLQITNPKEGIPCDQIYSLDLNEAGDVKRKLI